MTVRLMLWFVLALVFSCGRKKEPSGSEITSVAPRSAESAMVASESTGNKAGPEVRVIMDEDWVIDSEPLPLSIFVNGPVGSLTLTFEAPKQATPKVLEVRIEREAKGPPICLLHATTRASTLGVWRYPEVPPGYRQSFDCPPIEPMARYIIRASLGRARTTMAFYTSGLGEVTMLGQTE